MATLTPISIKNLRPPQKRREIPDGAARGLFLVQQPSGKTSFAVRFRINGKPRKLTLDRGLTLAEARVAAAKVYTDIERGHDPIMSKRTAKQAKALADANTFQAISEEYMRREGGKLRSADWRRPCWNGSCSTPWATGRLPRSSAARLSGCSTRSRRASWSRTANGSRAVSTMADRTLAIIRKIMNWHATRSDDFRSPIVKGMARTKPSESARSRSFRR